LRLLLQLLVLLLLQCLHTLVASLLLWDASIRLSTVAAQNPAHNHTI
jgi:hypothetical protein